MNNTNQSKKLPKFGNPIPFCEPSWYQSGLSPYYTKKHCDLRQKARNFVEKEMKPYVNKWIKTGYPLELHKKCYNAGLQGITYPKEYGGQAEEYDPFLEYVLIDEFTRMGGGAVLGHNAINSMALPPIIENGSDYLKKKVVKDVVIGNKNMALAISEPYAGSDVSALRTTAKLNKEGTHYIVNGQKKWISGGYTADYFTTAVRTGDKGPAGISLLLLEKNMKGIKIRKMPTQFDTSFSTCFVILDNVMVPKEHLIGVENTGFMQIMTNFNHERFVIAVGACRLSRMCYEAAITWALKRKTFGKRLVQHQIVRFKLAEMARQIEALQDFCDRICYQFKCGIPDWKLGGQCALLKVQASKTFEYCSREASQILGGNSIIREGQGQLVERLSREVRAMAIPGGSEEVLLDFAMRQVVAKADHLKQKGKL